MGHLSPEKLERTCYQRMNFDHPYDYGNPRNYDCWGYWVEWRSSGALSVLAGSGASGSILLLSTRGVSTRVANSDLGVSTGPACSTR